MKPPSSATYHLQFLCHKYGHQSQSIRIGSAEKDLGRAVIGFKFDIMFENRELLRNLFFKKKKSKKGFN